MKIRCYVLSLFAVLMLCAGLAFPAAARAEEKTEEYPVDAFPYKSLDLLYGCIDDETRRFYVTYNDGMLLEDSFEESPDLAKLSAGLAAAAYRPAEIKGMLIDMGFVPLSADPDDPEAQWESDDFLYNYDRAYTFEENDYVGYSIGRKRIEYQGTVYYAYVVAVRGTTGSKDWYSNFNIGSRSDGYHQGFKLSADEIIETLQNGVDTENNIILFTGHSRGAAVANIVAGEYNRGNVLDNTQSRQMFCYTFACPNVIREDAETLAWHQNIRNYNNAGDAITVVPPGIKGWDFHRYGIDVELSLEQDVLSTVYQRFLSVHGVSYAGLRTTDSFTEILKAVAATYEASQSSANKFLFDVAAWGIGDKSLDSIPKLIDKHGMPNKKKVKKVLVQFAKEAIIGAWTASTDSEYLDIRMLFSEINNFIGEMSEVTDEEAFMTAYNNDSISKRIKDETEYDPQTMAEVFQVRDELEEQVRAVNFLDAGAEDLFKFIFTAGQHNVKNEISHAHTGETYLQWINTMFYGYEGWRDSDLVTSFTVPDKYTIGEKCFYDCDSLEEIVINSSSGYVDGAAFGACSGTDITLTMPIDFTRIYPAAFGASNNQSVSQHDTSKISTLHYTAGRTGIQRDRKPFADSDWDGVYYMNVPEYYLRSAVRNIEFGEGIKHIGKYAWESSSRDSMYGTYVAACEIKSVTWPESLESIGDYAFFGRNIKNDSFLGTVRTIGDLAFHDSQFEGTCVIGAQVEYIGDRAFCEASYDELILLNPDTEMHQVFGNPIHKVTIPVDTVNASEKLGVVYTAGNANSIRELHYTPGKTGVMPARTAYHDASGSNRFFYCLEAKAQGIKKIIFEEGVTEICQSSLVRADIQLPKSLVTITEDLSGSHEYVADGAYLYKIDVPCCKTIYGYPDTAAREYASRKNLDFIPLHQPQFEEVSTDDVWPNAYMIVERGSSVTVPVAVYTGIDETTDQVEWIIEGSLSSGTVIDGSGCLTLGEDEPVWNFLLLKAVYDGYESRLRIYVDRKASWNTVTLDPMGGTLPEGSEVVHVERGTYVKDADLPIPVMDGYVFDHWYYYYDDEGAETERELTDYDTLDMINELYAEWREGDPPEPQYTDISGFEMILDQDEFPYTGEENRPSVTIKNGDLMLTEGQDYELVYRDNVNAGTAVATANGIGVYCGKVSREFDIRYVIISFAEVEEIPDQYYTGSEICPAPVVRVNGVLLEAGRDYTYVYRDNIKIGKASIDITGDGNYLGGLTVHFSIVGEGNVFGEGLTWDLEETQEGSGEYILVIRGNGRMEFPRTEEPDEETPGYRIPWETQKAQIVSAEVGEGVTNVGNWAFRKMPSLRTVSLPSTLTRIEDEAFAFSDSLSDIVIPDEVTYVGSSAFACCSSLKSVQLPEKLQTLESRVFFNTGLESLAIPRTVRTIYNFACDGCTSLTDVVLQEGLTAIMDYAFRGCTALETVRLPGTLEVLGSAFAGCTSLRSIELPDSLKRIGAAFMGCISLETVEIPDGTRIGSRIFEDCVSLRSVKIGKHCNKDIDYLVLPFDDIAHPNLTVIGYKDSWAEYIVRQYKQDNEECSFTFIAILEPEDYTVTIADQTYTGKALKPDPTVEYHERALTKGTDYTVTYKNNTKAGTASVTIKGVGNYTGTLTADFTIAKAKQPWTARAEAGSIAVGKTTKITVSGLKESAKLTYSSADKTIAAVSSSGVITAKAVGTVKITVKAAATDNYKAAAVTLTVKVVPAATSSVTLTNTSSGAKVTWKKVEGATGYYVYRGGKEVKKITKGSTVTFTDKNAKTNGTKYTYKIVAFAGTGESTLSKSAAVYYVSRPAVTALTSTTAKKLTVTWSRNAKASGYQIEYGRKSSFADSKTVTVSSGSTVKKVLSSLSSKSTYYVRVRAYKTVSGTKYYSAWSAAKSIKVK